MDIYSEVTTRIIAQMEEGVIPWQKLWVANGKAISRSTGKPYSLLNQMLLGRLGEYVTFKQCQQEGGKVKKGEKSRLVVFWKWIEQEDEETGEKKEVPFLRYFNVFHIDQCEGITAKHTQETNFPDGADTLAAALLAMKEKERNLIVLHYYSWHTLNAVAEMMGMSYINAKVIHKNAQLLQEIMGNPSK